MVLAPGDLLFVPKGDYHRAEVADAGGQSLHLTVAIQRPDGADYRGEVARTKDGIKCRAWSDQSPHAHTKRLDVHTVPSHW